ncbi:MAG: preprotein translocase subunit SecY [Thermoflexus sp.]|jgi:preprotein translocase subunit SecY|uniref:Protein translocase subunit SecY n=1 Tax=Thermoflexus hugenholtzii JAD2 TaxID=877466 RepID=A0A212RH97_9CHLR|nr:MULTISPECIES: preprotein translocase subunit SecY [Thermoflexus]MDT7883545.1 preprotein translocase subunit SecY [Thermoflexus sp.]MDT7947091.1 preprotein translocase subunit SecY [Thermoflexus sp.]QWK10811.1 MAG: preprotein translocase subunit SecY [Thermoflexus hugenholtzii]SNB71630.1 protein translocase subunit secY/sec61 alpha [Thermoflexus hugenholtzii JAD2]
MLDALRNAWHLPDLRRKILYTLLILAIYRLAAHIPVPGVDRAALQQLLQGTTAAGQLYIILDLLSGGAIANFSIMAMGVYPYVTASIILQLLVPVVPQLERLVKEGGSEGRRKLEQYTYFLTVPLAALYAIGQANLLSAPGRAVLPNFGFAPHQLLPTLTVILTMTAGTMFAIWLGQLITEQGIGNGLSLIIFGGIVARAPYNLAQIWTSNGTLGILVFLALTVITVAAIVFIQEGQRRIPVQYGRRVRGHRIYGGGSTYIPLRVNMAGMIPLILAQSVLAFPAIIAQFFQYSSNAIVASIANTIVSVFSGFSDIYWPMYFITVVAFTYFYTDVMLQQMNLADTLQKQGGFIPGIRPGKATEQYINRISRRITLVGALFLGILAILPWPVRAVLQTNVLLFSSAALLIVVGVVLDTMRQLEAQLVMRHYEGFIR